MSAVCYIVIVFALNSFAQVILPNDLESLALRIDKGNAEQKRDALFQLRNFKTAEASRIALPALKDSSEIVRATAAGSVIFLPPDEAAKNLLPLLNDKKSFVRREAAYALGLTGNPFVIQPLIQTFQKEKSGEVRNTCVVALGEIGDVSAVNFLTQILQKSPKKDDDANEFLRRSAARSIGQIAQFLQTGNLEVRTPQNLLIKNDNEIVINLSKNNLSTEISDFRLVVLVLIKILQNPKEADDTKRETAFALGAIGDEKALQTLQTHLNASDYYLAQICRESIIKIKNIPKLKSPE